MTSPAALSPDPVATFKQRQRETWALGNFADIATFTTQAAGHLVPFAGVTAGQHVLDVGTGTGVVAITAARIGANVTGIDLTPELVAKARASAELAGVSVTWQEGDAERLPFADATFDVVLSQFGHMFAPRPEAATAEMLRVLKPGGRIAFATWPPEELIGRAFALLARYVPPPPGGAPPPAWGDPRIVEHRLGSGVRDTFFERGWMTWPALSPAHYRAMHETVNGPFIRVVTALAGDPVKLAQYRAEFDALTAPYLRANVVRHEYLLTRATKA